MFSRKSLCRSREAARAGQADVLEEFNGPFVWTVNLKNHWRVGLCCLSVWESSLVTTGLLVPEWVQVLNISFVHSSSRSYVSTCRVIYFIISIVLILIKKTSESFLEQGNNKKVVQRVNSG